MNVLKNISLLTCTFNQHLLTKMMIMSFFKKIDNLIPVIIMDNSTKTFCPDDLKKQFTVINNTNFKLTPDYGQVSKNHCASIEYALKNCIKTKYVLLCDNGILFKPTIVELFNEINKFEDFDVIGEIGCDSTPPNRLFPYLNFINVDKLKKDNISYFNETDMKCKPVGTRLDCIYNDTGSTFLHNIKDKWKIRELKMDNYIVHLRGASYNPFMKIEDWLNKYKEYI